MSLSNFILIAILTFICGALYEASCVFWVHFSEKGSAKMASAISMLVATCTLAGIGASLHDIKFAPFYILGYGFGTYMAVKIKQR